MGGLRFLKYRISIYSLILLPAVLAFHTKALAQQHTLQGTLRWAASQAPARQADLILQPGNRSTYSHRDGSYRFRHLHPGTYTLTVLMAGAKTKITGITISDKDIQLDLLLDSLRIELDAVEIRAKAAPANRFGIRRLNAVEGSAIYESKKTEVIELQDVNANMATNNPRQLFAKVAGLNVWESDGGGLQLGIGARGLNPNRSAEFNTRQNGYDISADAIGYPESYYTPPAEALERIEVVRGAASLQYGTQFGGMVNFVFKRGDTSRPLALETRQTLGSFGLFNSYTGLGGSRGPCQYQGFYQYKRSNGWRENAGFQAHTAHLSNRWQASTRLRITTEYTFMYYLAQQPGGLTDLQFAQTPRISLRNRNWFNINWNLFSVSADYRINEHTAIDTRFFALVAGRESLGFLGVTNRTDDNSPRDLIADTYRNLGNETRLIHKYTLGRMHNAAVAGLRLYRGHTQKKQGTASAGSGPDFAYLNPDNLEGSTFTFPGYNAALFAEHIFAFSPAFSITPGMRLEYIRTQARGYYQQLSRYEGNTPIYTQVFDTKNAVRYFPLFGIGSSYRPNPNIEVYANASQNYRAITFTDLRVANPSSRIDPNLRDERGYNMDLGARGTIGDFFSFDANLFYLAYNQRIGTVLVTDTAANIYRYRTNIADSRHVGIESFAELDFIKLFTRRDSLGWSMSLFGAVTVLDARYITANKRFKNKQVEMAAPLIARTGLTLRRRSLSATLQYAYTAQHFSDASNAVKTPSAIEGLIPAYYVMDFSLNYQYRWLLLGGSVNNLTNNLYFTRRAVSYPGPGIIPADGRSFSVMVGGKF